MNVDREEGVAILIAMMALLLMTALGVALILTTSSETVIAAHFREAAEGLYAADAVAERALDDLPTVPDWNALLAGSARSAFVDGPPSGDRTLPDGSTINVSQVVNMANCRKITDCSVADMDLSTDDRPWGQNNPRWMLYAYGNLEDLLLATINSPYYVIAMVGDDPSETDNDPTKDGADETNPGSGVIAMRAEAFGPRGAHKVIELTAARRDGRVRMLSWREVR
jgi:hypothetical protein